MLEVISEIVRTLVTGVGALLALCLIALLFVGVEEFLKGRVKFRLPQKIQDAIIIIGILLFVYGLGYLIRFGG